MKKRILSILLTIFMLTLTIAPMTAYAESGSSGSGAYGALLTPDTTPPAGWAEDESNPYGTKKGQPFAITPWHEPIIYSYRNAEGQAAQDHTKVYSKWTFGINIAECTPSAHRVSCTPTSERRQFSGDRNAYLSQDSAPNSRSSPCYWNYSYRKDRQRWRDRF